MALIVRVKYKLYKSTKRRLFSRKSGVHRNSLRIGTKIANNAKVQLGRSPKRIDTGRLRASIKVSSFSGKSGFAGVRVGTNVEYAPYVHDGTRYMRANPFLANAVRQIAR